MADRHRRIKDLADAILDGTPVDWPAAETGTSEAERRVIENLRLLSAVANVHRQAPPGTPGDHSACPRWGHLRLLERIGGGSFGEVYRAWDTRLDREVALKLIPAQGGPDDSQALSILNEARLLARVRHPGVVTIHDAQQIADRVGLCMEFVRGRTIEQRLEQEGALDAHEAVDLGVELCRALATVHGAGLLHRDIKAQNVVLADDGRIVLMDFGTGRRLDDASPNDLAGTPLYLAPEVFQRQPATVRSDIYSLGVLLYHVLTGEYPVHARTVTELCEVHARQERRRLRDARPDLSAALAAVVDRALDPQPARRHGSAEELAADLMVLRRLPSRWLSGVWVQRMGLAGAAAVLVFSAGDPAADTRARGALGVPGSLLIGTFAGTTGDRDLEAILQQAVVAQLEQSPHLNVFPPARVRAALGRMHRRATATIDEQLGLELCAREGVAALVTGSVEMVGGLYVLHLHARHGGTGRLLASVPERAGSREETLEAVSRMSHQLRVRLGEALTSIQATSAPLEPVTSRSVEAVRHFTLGKQLYDVERAREALPHFLNAVRLDSTFAMAYAYAALAYGYLGEHEHKRKYLETAASLALDPASQMDTSERTKILADYETYFERFDEAAAHGRTLLNVRPADGRVRANLGLIYGMMRQYDEAIVEFETALRTYPHPRIRWMLADVYSAAGQPALAVQLAAEQLEQPFEWIAYARHLLIAGEPLEAESALMEAERRAHLSSNASWPDLALAQADFLRSQGRYREADAALQQGLDRGGTGGVERLQLARAALLIDWERRAEAAAQLGGLDIGLARNRIVHGVLAARAGNLETARGVLERLTQEAAGRGAPRRDARVHQLRAEIALAERRTTDAHGHARLAVHAFTTTWTLVTLARAQEAAGKLTEAMGTWTTVVERAGERAIDWDAPAFSQAVLARYELARLLERSGRLPEAHARYDEFLRLWDRADPDLARLAAARAPRRRAGQGAQSAPAGRVPKPAA